MFRVFGRRKRARQCLADHACSMEKEQNTCFFSITPVSPHCSKMVRCIFAVACSRAALWLERRSSFQACCFQLDACWQLVALSASTILIAVPMSIVKHRQLCSKSIVVDPERWLEMWPPRRCLRQPPKHRGWPWTGLSATVTPWQKLVFFPKASPMLGFSFSLLEGGGGARTDRTLVWTGCMMMERDGCDTGWMWYGMGVMGVWYGICVLYMGWVWYGMGVIRDGCDGCVIRGWVWYGMGVMGVDGGEDGRWRERDGVWTGVDGGVDGRWRGARRGVDGCGRRCGWKMERPCTKHVSGLVSNMLRCGLKYSGNWGWKGLQMEMMLGERGVVVGGQRSCTKHVSGLVSNMLRCGLKYSRNWGWRGCFLIYLCIFLIHAGRLPTVFCGRLQPEKGVAFGFAGSPCFFAKKNSTKIKTQKPSTCWTGTAALKFAPLAQAVRMGSSTPTENTVWCDQPLSHLGHFLLLCRKAGCFILGHLANFMEIRFHPQLNKWNLQELATDIRTISAPSSAWFHFRWAGRHGKHWADFGWHENYDLSWTIQKIGILSFKGPDFQDYLSTMPCHFW